MVQVIPVQRGIVHVALCGLGFGFQTVGHPSSWCGTARERKCISEHPVLSQNYRLPHSSPSPVVFSSEQWSSTFICSLCPVPGRSRKKRADPDLEWAWRRGHAGSFLHRKTSVFSVLSLPDGTASDTGACPHRTHDPWCQEWKSIPSLVAQLCLTAQHMNSVKIVGMTVARAYRRVCLSSLHAL